MTQKRSAALLAACALPLLLIVCGSFWDYPISAALYSGQTLSENFFGILFLAIGILPSYLGWCFLAAALWVLCKKRGCHLANRIWMRALSVFIFLAAFFFLRSSLNEANEAALALPEIWPSVFGIALIAAAGFFGGYLAARSKNPDLLKQTLFLIAVSLVLTIVLLNIKDLVSRPRFRWLLAEGDPSLYRDWWQGGWDIRAALGENAVRDHFSSFPSGHAAYAMFGAFFFPALADYAPRLAKHRGLLAACGYGWWALTALSRIVVGAHYLTDVCFGGLLTALIFGLLYPLYRFSATRKKTK